MITLKKLAEELHVDSGNIRKKCLKTGIPMSKHPRQTDSGIQEMLCVDSEGESRLRDIYSVPRWDERTEESEGAK